MRVIRTDKFKSAAQKCFGYKIVGIDGERLFSIYSKDTINQTIGSTMIYRGAGLFLGTSEQFCLDYYSGGHDGPDAMLTYSFDLGDIIRGDPTCNNGEIQVRRATLVKIARVEQEEAQENGPV